MSGARAPLRCGLRLARAPRWISLKAPARGEARSRASTPPTSDAVLSPEIEYVRRLYVQCRGPLAAAANFLDIELRLIIELSFSNLFVFL